MRARWARSLALILGLLLLAACGGAAGGGSAADDAPIDEGATLRAGWNLAPNTLDPLYATSESPWFREGISLVYDRLFTVDSAGVAKGMLVRDFSYSDDGLVLDLTLREDASFRDGRKVDAEVVKINLDRTRAATDSPVAGRRLAVVLDVAVAGPFQVRITLKTPSPSVPYALAEMAGMMLHPDLISNGDPSMETNGSGAYSVEEYIPAQRLVLVRDRTDYWDPDAAKIARFEHQVFSDPNALSNAVLSGDIDLALMSPTNLAAIEGRRGVTVVPVKHGFGVELLINRGLAPVNDVRVRQAINHAIDREGISKALFPGSEPKFQYFREGLSGYDPAIRPYPRDVAKAKALLAEAGYPDGIDLGELLVQGQTMGGLPAALQAQLGEAGIRAAPTVMEVLPSIAKYGEGKTAIYLSVTSTGTEPSAGAAERFAPRLNPAGTTPEFDRLLAAAADSRLSPEERSAGYGRLNAYLVDDAWAAPIIWITYPWATSDRVVGLSQDMDYATTVGPIDYRYLAIRQG